MNPSAGKGIKDNVLRFDDDVRRTGSYVYTSEKPSSRYANERISKSIADGYTFRGKRVLDLGCGDGTYTLEFASLGAKEVLGIDPAEAAVETARRKAKDAGLADQVSFEPGNIYALKEQLDGQVFDCVVLRGVLHHLPDPARAIDCVAALADTVIILEPNGCNPVLKVLERFSRYHVDHEERSFLPATIKSWCKLAGLHVASTAYINLVPMFCPDWMARCCRRVEPLFEEIPLLWEIICGQCLIIAERK